MGIMSNDLSERQICKLNNEQLYSSLNNVKLGIGLYDIDGHIQFFNEHALKHMNMELSDLVGKSVIEVFDGEKGEEYYQRIKHVVSTKKTCEFEDKVCFQNQEKWFTSTYSPLYDELGVISGVQIVSNEITQSKKNEIALKESEHRFRKLSNLTFEGIMIHNNGVVIDVNETIVTMFGYSREELIGNNIIQLLIPEEFHSIIKENICRGYAKPYEICARKKDGTVIPVEVEARDINYKSEQFRVAAIRDISDRKRDKEALKESEQQYQRLFDNAADLITVVDKKGTFIDLNKKFEEESLYAKEEMIGKNVLTSGIVTKKSSLKILSVLKSIIQGKPAPIIEVDGVTKKGDLVPYELRAVPVFKDNRIIGAQAILRNLSERKYSEKVLRESEEKYRTLIEALNEGIWKIDKNAVTTFVNQHMADMLGCAVDEMIGESLFSFMDDRGKKIAKEKLEQRKQGEYENHDFEFIRKDGKRLYAALETSPILDESGEYNGAIAGVIDLTERRLAENELQKRYESEQVISKISSWFINPSEIDQCVTDSLKELGQLCNASRSYLFMIHEDGKLMNNTHEWCANGVSPQMEMLQNIPVNEFPWWMHQLKKGEFIQISDLSEIPDEGWKERENLAMQQIKSLLVMPLRSDSELFGFIGFDNTVESYVWTNHERKTLLIFSEIISTFLQKKKIEEKLIETKERLSLALKGAEIGTWDWDLTTDIVRFDERWAGMLGYKLDEISPHISSWERLVHVDDMPGVKKKLRDHLDGNTSFYDAEFRMKHKSGEWIWILDRGKVIERNENNQPIRMTGTHVDISEMKNAQEKIVDAKKLYQNLFLNAQVGLFRTDVKTGKMLEANDALASFVGYCNREDLLSDEYKISDHYLHPDDRNRMIAELEKHGEVVNFEAPFKRLDGTVMWARFSARLSIDKTCIEGVSEDVTTEHNAINALRENEERFRNLSEMLPEAVIETDADLQVTFSNDKAFELMDYSPDDLKGGINGLDMFPPDERERVKQNLARRIGGESLGSVEYQAVKSNGKLFPVLVHANPILKDGVFQGIRAVIVDISELKRVQDELKSLNEQLEEKVEDRTSEIKRLLRQKDEFINQLGHDLKNPLGPFMQLLPILRNHVTDEKDEKMVEVLERNANYMRNLVKKTIELAKLNSSKNPFHFERASLSDLVEEVISVNTSLFDNYDVVVKNNVSSDCFARVDCVHIQEVFMNLFTNAVKYMEGSGSITVEAKCSDQHVLVSVKDTGVGLTKDQISRLFDEYYKADTSRHDFESSGLGLSICKRIIARHDGRIWAESSGLGKGSTFYFTLPKVDYQI